MWRLSRRCWLRRRAASSRVLQELTRVERIGTAMSYSGCAGRDPDRQPTRSAPVGDARRSCPCFQDPGWYVLLFRRRPPQRRTEWSNARRGKTPGGCARLVGLDGSCALRLLTARSCCCGHRRWARPPWRGVRALVLDVSVAPAGVDSVETSGRPHGAPGPRREVVAGFAVGRSDRWGPPRVRAALGSADTACDRHFDRPRGPWLVLGRMLRRWRPSGRRACW